MSTEQLAAIKARRAAVSDSVARMAIAYTEADAAFIAAAPADVDTLLAECERLTQHNDFLLGQYQAGWDEAMRTKDSTPDLTDADVANTASRQIAWQGEKIRALTAERDALAAELATVRAQLATVQSDLEMEREIAYEVSMGDDL